MVRTQFSTEEWVSKKSGESGPLRFKWCYNMSNKRGEALTALLLNRIPPHPKGFHPITNHLVL